MNLEKTDMSRPNDFYPDKWDNPSNLKMNVTSTSISITPKIFIGKSIKEINNQWNDFYCVEEGTVKRKKNSLKKYNKITKRKNNRCKQVMLDLLFSSHL